MTVNGTHARWRLATVTIRHFRGVAQERTYAFDGHPVMIHGNNGVGKSTIAVALQWILFGRFHAGVLANSKVDSFLSPVQAGANAYSGEIVLVRGPEQLVISRDAATRAFTVRLGNKSWNGDEAESKRDELLGLDMDTFVRAVLLQQSRIRGLLLDEPKERNKALDRLLGMDTAEQFLEVIRPKDLERSAEGWRAEIHEEEQDLRSQELLLGQQLAECQRTARDLKFLNKDLNTAGLSARYVELFRDLVALGRKYKVEMEELPTWSGMADTSAASRGFERGVKRIRLGAELRKRLTPLQRAIAELTAIEERTAEALKERDAVAEALQVFSKKHGERKDLVAEQTEANRQSKAFQRELKEADALRELLHDAYEFVKETKPTECPLCERVLPERSDLAARLRQRADGAATSASEAIQKSVGKTQSCIQAIASALEELTELEKVADAARKALERIRTKAGEVLGAAIPENKLQMRIDEALRARREDEQKLGQVVEAMEDDLEGIERREGAIRAVLLPVAQKRAEVMSHEQKMDAAKKRHAKTEARAGAIEKHAAELETIRKAIIAAKEDVANDLLAKAAPRAQELYRRLVRQPKFDVLEVEANARAAKVDYTFQVRVGAHGPARDARFVLSDGQLTATAIALFFALAESTHHALDLLYVDDPTQNLDLPCKEAMAKVVTEIARRRQVVVSTQDEDFVTHLVAEGFPKLGIVHHIKAWDGDPTVETSGPKAA